MSVLRRLLHDCRQSRWLSTDIVTNERHPILLGLEAVTSILTKAQATDITVMDMREKCSYTDYFVLATGSSDRHIKRLSSAVLFKLKEEMRRSEFVDLTRDLPPEVQGDGSSEWIVVDAGRIFVHLMTESKRRFLDLAGLWDSKEEKAASPTTVPLTKDTISIEETAPEVPCRQLDTRSAET